MHLIIDLVNVELLDAYMTHGIVMTSWGMTEQVRTCGKTLMQRLVNVFVG